MYSQCQCSKGIHNEIDPQQLYCSEDTLIGVAADCRDKSEGDGSDVDSNLELFTLDISYLICCT